MTFIDFCVKYKWWLSIGGFLTLGMGIGIVALPLGIIGFVKSPKSDDKDEESSTQKSKTGKRLGFWDVAGKAKNVSIIAKLNGKCPECGGQLGAYKCKKCKLDIQSWAADQVRKDRKTLEDVSIPNAVIKNSVTFFGGHKEVSDPTNGWLAIANKKVIFKNANKEKFEIKFEDIENIEITDDSYTPSLARGLVMGFLGGDTDSQSFRPHKSVLKIVYDTGKRKKDLSFNFNAITWAGSVSECQKFYGKLNALLD